MKKFQTILLATFLAFVFTGCITRDKGRTYKYEAAHHPKKPHTVAGVNEGTTTTTTTTTQAAPTPQYIVGAYQLVKLDKTAPATASVGQTYENKIIVDPQADVGEVVLTHYLPAGATFMKAEPPPASVSGNKLVWTWNELKKAEKQTVTVWLTPTGEGVLRSCSTIHAVPISCVVTKVGKLELTIEKTGPATAQVGERVPYNIVVKNVGTTAATGVEVTDTLPPGMSHDSGKRELVFEAGDLAPGEAKQASVTLIASERGTHTNTVVAKSTNAGSVSDTAVTKVVQPGLKVEKTGPPQQFLGKTANYNITVSNTGDTTLNNVTLTDIAPTNAVIAGASGASVAGRQATWNVGTLNTGESKSVNLGLRASRPGVTVNNVVARSGDLSDRAQAQTLWRGFAAVLVEMVDNPDPLLIGESTTYTLKVTNQGTAEDRDVNAVIRFPAQVTPTAAGGVTQGTIAGNTVTFAPLASIAAKQVATWTIKAKAASVGDARVSAEITTALLKGRPVTEVEATQVY
ncbi:MAG: hypothetical protein CMO80_08475 [Verrucomicrobiales bacterium]|nr:hypothetical protein [Verrucomicrobiales bacterium]|tara:strand:+ start:105 stop:1652 length:1548 start_codon:yes stop_codon:yes gene_type:complete